VTHLGQRLSALIDGELETFERQRVLYHVTRCPSCSDEVAALRALKRRTNAAFRESQASAGLTGPTGLTARLMGLSERLGVEDPRWAAASPGHEHDSRPDQRAGRLFLVGSVAIFLAGLGTAAVIAGGDPQARAPAPPVTPSVDVLVAPHNAGGQVPMSRTGTAVLQARLRNEPSFPIVGGATLPGQP